MCWYCTGSKFKSQHLHQASHNCLGLKLRGISSSGLCGHRTHITPPTHTHINISFKSPLLSHNMHLSHTVILVIPFDMAHSHPAILLPVHVPDNRHTTVPMRKKYLFIYPYLCEHRRPHQMYGISLIHSGWIRPSKRENEWKQQWKNDSRLGLLNIGVCLLPHSGDRGQHVPCGWQALSYQINWVVFSKESNFKFIHWKHH